MTCSTASGLELLAVPAKLLATLGGPFTPILYTGALWGHNTSKFPPTFGFECSSRIWSGFGGWGGGLGERSTYYKPCSNNRSDIDK
jgi:hypothetical protein